MSRLPGFTLLLTTMLVQLAPGSVATAHAHEPAPATRRWRPPVSTPIVTVDVVDDHGFALPSARHHGRTFVAGDRGERYALRLHNHTDRRLEVVVSVDGRDVVSGDLANPRTQRGYVIEPFGDLTIEGFRTSLENVAAFRFSDLRNSYAARRGSASRVGVIAVSAFREREARPSPLARHESSPSTRGRSAAPSDGSADSAPSRAPRKSARPRGGGSSEWGRSPSPQRLGTEFGESVHSSVRRVSFVRRHDTSADATIQVFYDSAHALAQRGIPIEDDAFAFEETPSWGRGSSSQHFAPPPPRR